MKRNELMKKSDLIKALAKTQDFDHDLCDAAFMYLNKEVSETCGDGSFMLDGSRMFARPDFFNSVDEVLKHVKDNWQWELQKEVDYENGGATVYDCQMTEQEDGGWNAALAYTPAMALLICVLKMESS